MREAVVGMHSDYHGKVAMSATTFLARWNGGSVRVRELTVSLRTLAIVVFRDHATLQKENLRFAVEPLWMCGPFEWAPAALDVDVVPAADTRAAAFARDDQLFQLRDQIGFELLTPSLEVAENVALR
jgi:hypothetical protein